MELKEIISEGKFKIIVKTNSSKTEIIKFDNEKKALKLNVKALPEKGKANTEIIKFFSKKTKKKVEIVSGKTSKTKILKLS